MAGRQNLRAEFAGGVKKIAELDRLVAFQTRHRGLAGHVALRETINHRFLEPALIVQHVVRNADAFGDHTGVVNIPTGAASPLTVGGRTVVVELERDADHIVAGVGQECRRDRRIDPARHRNDNARVGRLSVEIEAIDHGVLL